MFPGSQGTKKLRARKFAEIPEASECPHLLHLIPRQSLAVQLPWHDVTGPPLFITKTYLEIEAQTLSMSGAEAQGQAPSAVPVFLMLDADRCSISIISSHL